MIGVVDRDWIEQTDLKSIQRDVKVFDVDRISSIVRVYGGREELGKPVSVSCCLHQKQISVQRFLPRYVKMNAELM